MLSVPSTMAGHSGAEPRLWRRWALATAIGELVGFAAPAFAWALVARAVAGMGAPAAALLTFAVLVAAGSVEGAVLGYAQWRALRHALPAIRWPQWTGATAIAAALAWALGMLPNTLMDAAGVGVGGMIAAWAIVAPAILLSIGVAQWLVLRRHLPRAALWIPANIVGWILGLAPTFIGPALASETTPVWALAAIAVASGLAMGCIVGGVTGWALLRLLRNAGRGAAG
jgi:NhaP-type Na+/H+ or K+/H+ antiporter